ncbi:Helix-turn-helix [Pantoea agglomerans]|uniref:Helix-turn-helix n=1 Tax=Enterobacter agglomerans TaxID=549 RepID=A0A379LS71_ENTAG|nr:Helix-turn-helix [Pantoea agglomerans]
MNTPISIIASALVRERQRAGLSLAEVARRAGIAKSTLSQLEAGNGNPGIETTVVALRNAEHSIFTSAGAGCASSAGDSAWRGPDGNRRSGRLSGRFAGLLPRPAFGVISICWKFSPAANAFPSPISPIPLSILLSLKGVRWWARSTVRWSWMWGITLPIRAMSCISFGALEADTMALLVIEHS